MKTKSRKLTSHNHRCHQRKLLPFTFFLFCFLESSPHLLTHPCIHTHTHTTIPPPKSEKQLGASSEHSPVPCKRTENFKRLRNEDAELLRPFVANYLWKAEFSPAVGLFLPVLYREESCHPKHKVCRLLRGTWRTREARR